jgi:hypothetical protein
VGLKDKLFGKQREPQAVEIPAILQPEDPVNYNSVLDWLLGLSDKDYKTMLEVVQVYREAGKTTAKLLKIKDQPSTVLLPTAPSEEQIDADLDTMLNTHPDDLTAAFLADDDKPVEKKKSTKQKVKQIQVEDK